MNRTVLTQTYVSNGHSYANDALQTICTKIYPFDVNVIMNHPNMDPYTAEVKSHADNQTRMIKFFNHIVSKGKDFALKFIKANWYLVSNSPYEEPENPGELDKNGYWRF